MASSASVLGRIKRLSGVTAVVSLLLIPSVRRKLAALLGEYAPNVSWRTVAIILAVSNLKNLPLVWHLRIFGTMWYQLYLQRTPIKPEMLFYPVITSTRSPLTEMDYNGHKSNSTYFSDLDQARTNLVIALLRNGIRNAREPTREDYERYKYALGKPDLKEVPKGVFTVALGGVTCHFRKEVQPYEKVEIWTRLLCWDRKWLYWVSYIVKAGTVKPSSYTLQPWKRARSQKEETQEEMAARIGKAKKAVKAVSIAKYVVKKGRLTIPPELALQNAGMLPPKPEGAPPAAKVPIYAKASELSPPVALEPSGISGTATPSEGVSPPMNNVLEESFFPSAEGGEWTWEKVETERMKGLRFAEHFAALDGLYDTFDGEGPAMGKWADLFSL